MSWVDRAPKTDAHYEEEHGRRTFVARLVRVGGILWAAVAALPLLSFLVAPKREEEVLAELFVGEKAKFEPGSVTKFGYGRKPAFLIVDKAGNITAISAVCTHLGCTVQQKDQGFYCACHGGRYDMSGRNISGPPPKPLAPYVVEIRDGDQVWVKRG